MIVKSTLVWIFSILILLTSIIWFGEFGFSQTDTAPVDTRQIEGTVLRKEGDRLFVDTGQGVREVRVPSNVSVTRNSVRSGINNIEPDDRVIVTTNMDGQVLSVSATSREVFDWTRLGLPLILLAALAAGVFTYIIRRSRPPRINTEEVPPGDM